MKRLKKQINVKISINVFRNSWSGPRACLWRSGGELQLQDYFLSALWQLGTSGRVGASCISIRTSFLGCLGPRTRCHCSPHYGRSHTSICPANIQIPLQIWSSVGEPGTLGVVRNKILQEELLVWWMWLRCVVKARWPRQLFLGLWSHARDRTTVFCKIWVGEQIETLEWGSMDPLCKSSRVNPIISCLSFDISAELSFLMLF